MMYLIKEKYYDICFIGAGLSCTYTLLHYIENLEKKPEKNKVQICIIDKVNEFWTGIPYGQRSGFNSLIITSIKEFLPPEEREIFINWLQKNFNKLSENYFEPGIGLPSTWLKNNQQLIDDGLWEKLYVPRYLFGQFLKERMTALLNIAKGKRLLDYKLLNAEVFNIQKNNNVSYEVFATSPSGDQLSFQSKKVILSIGSPPKKELDVAEKKSSNFICIQDVYDPGMHENISRVFNFLEKSDSFLEKNLLILGSNASSLEVIYNLQNSQRAKQINKIYVLSPNGIFPHRINENKIPLAFDPVNLNSLRHSKSNTCQRILEAVKKDVQKAMNDRTEIADIYDSMSHAVIDLLNELNLHEQKEFVYKYGVEIGKLQRRAGAEYLDVANKLIAEKRLNFIKGKFLRQLGNNNRFEFEYLDFASNDKKSFQAAVDIIINCIGSEELSNSNSALIQNLIKQKICKVNGSNKGFDVDENFQSSKNFFVIGPLLSGTLNNKLRIWHAESCPRIFFLAQQLADYFISN